MVIWIGTGALILLAVIAWMLNFYLTTLSRQLEAIGNMMIGLGKQLDQEMERSGMILREIERHTRRQAKPLYKRDEIEEREKEENPFYYAQRDCL